MAPEQLAAEASKYSWYHCIELAPGVVTAGVEQFDRVCKFIEQNCQEIDYAGKSVLDVATRDCLHALRAERRGAREIVAIDNDISAGARDFVLPHFQSKIELRHQNLYQLQEPGRFDIVQFFGVLYHLRFPFLGLKRVADCCKIGGLLLVESGMLVRRELARAEILYCPDSENSPYEESSVTFFNCKGLDAALKSFGCERISGETYRETVGPIRRGFFVYRKNADISHGYWELDGTHTYHTRGSDRPSGWKPDRA